MIYGSVCSGIEAATVAWHPLGWRPAFFAEIEAFPRAVLAHHYLNVPCHGDFTTIGADEYGPIDLLVGGTPCQSFSVAGLRGGLADERGNLALEYLRLADRKRPRWLVWENVPGVLSIDDGRAFGSILGGMAQLGYGFAYRVLDAQHFGVPQRRRRVFVVGHLGDWRRAAAVLFERHSLQGNTPPRRQAEQGVAGCLSPGAHPGGFNGQDAYSGQLIAEGYTAGSFGGYREGCGALRAQGGDYGGGTETLIAHSLRGEGFDASEDGTGRGTPLVPHPMVLMERGRNGESNLEYRADGTANAILTPNGGRGGLGVGAICVADTLTSNGDAHSGYRDERGLVSVAFDTTQITSAANYSNPKPGDPCHPLASGAHPPAIAGSAVRRLTPTECARLQGFPDTYLDIIYRGKPAADGPKYKALGNSMAVPCMAWIGQRIALVDALHAEHRRAA